MHSCITGYCDICKYIWITTIKNNKKCIRILRDVISVCLEISLGTTKLETYQDFFLYVNFLNDMNLDKYHELNFTTSHVAYFVQISSRVYGVGYQ